MPARTKKRKGSASKAVKRQPRSRIGAETYPRKDEKNLDDLIDDAPAAETIAPIEVRMIQETQDSDEPELEIIVGNGIIKE